MTCDGCGTKFTLIHALECKVGGLIKVHHGEINHELPFQAAQVSTPFHMCNKPFITKCCVGEEMEVKAGRDLDSKEAVEDEVAKIGRKGRDKRDERLICNFWKTGTDAIYEVHMTDLDSKSQVCRDTQKVLAVHETAKKKKYLAPCLKQGRHFTPFVISCDSLMGREAKMFLQPLASKFALK